MRAAFALFFLALALPGCRGCRARAEREPARPREVALVEQALASDAGYKDAVADLEKDPKEALRAARQAGARPGTRRELVLKALADRLERPLDHRAWREKVAASASKRRTPLGAFFPKGVPSLVGKRHALFWTERLLVTGTATERALAARQLADIGGEVAAAALAIAVTDIEHAGLGSAAASEALARAGRGVALADGLAAWAGAGAPDEVRATGEAPLRQALRGLTPDARRRTATELLDALGRGGLPDATLRGYVGALREVAMAEHAARLAELRGVPWARPFRAEIDAALAAALEREENRGSRKR